MKFEFLILFFVLVLAFLGLATVFSVSPSLVKPQIINIVIGLIFFFILAKSDYKIFKNLGYFFYFISIFLLFLTFVFGSQVRGSVRWLKIGSLNLQPSELVKPILILFFAFLASQKGLGWKSVFKSLIFLILPFFLIFKQPDLGSSLVIFFCWLMMLFFSQLSFKKLLLIFFLVIFLIPLSFFLIKDYQKERILTFLNPSRDPLGSGYNTIQAVIAVGAGKVIGKGFLRGTQSQLRFLPESQTDFIFASLAEETGFLGSLLVIFSYLVILFKILKIGRKANDVFGQMICIGVWAMIFFQAFVNIGMCVGILPITGITLPFVSYGGSSMIALFASLGLVESVGQWARKEEYLEIK